jgi:hypothetical protein
MLVKSLEKRLASLPQERIDALLRRGGSADSREN